LGLLVGLQSESAASPLAGVRTFPLVTVLGTVCGLSSQTFGGWILAAGIAPSLLPAAAPWLMALLILSVVGAFGLWLRSGKDHEEVPEQENPSELKSALLFGLIYAVVLFAVAAVKERYGNRELYMVAGLSGLTDVDAITLSTAQLFNAGRLNAEDGWRLIVVAAVSNLIFKAGVVAALGRRRLFVRILPAYGIVIAAGILMLLFRS
jgi:uncharacterized membrane protein (DUF4010 family)